MKKLLLLVMALVLITSCENDIKRSTDPKPTVTQSQPAPVQESSAFRKGKQQLMVQGYKNIQETSYPLFCCAEEDSFLCSTGFTATDPQGGTVRGCICAKGCMFRTSVTIRFE